MAVEVRHRLEVVGHTRPSYCHNPAFCDHILWFFIDAVPVRTPAEYPIRLHELNLRFCSGIQVSPLSSPSDLEKADQILADISCREFDSKIAYGNLRSSYFDEYRDALCRSLQFQVHETQDNPLVCTF